MESNEPIFYLDQDDDSTYLIKRGNERFTAGHDKQKVVDLIERLNNAHRPNVHQGERNELFVCWNTHEKGEKCDYEQQIWP